MQALILFLSFALHAGRFASAVDVSVPLSAPPGSQPLSSTLISFSIEQDRWPDWTGVDSRNEFTYNALQNYADLTGKPPKIRVGADSEDRTFWVPTDIIIDSTFPAPDAITPYPEASNITVGDQFYLLSRFLPKDTRMVWGVNFGANNVTNAVNMALSIARAFSSAAVKASGVILDRIEVGNEADIYNFTGHREGTWTAEDYVSQWIANAGPVADAVGIQGNDGPVALQGAAFAIPVFPVTEIFDLGILDSVPGKAISTIAQHHYSVFSCDGEIFPLAWFLNKTAIRGNLTIFESDIAATKAKGLKYVLSETSNIPCHSGQGTIDYALQAATLGIQDAFFHHGVGYRYNFFQPVALNRSILDGSPLDTPLAPHIMPSYYAGLVIGTFIGKTGVSEIVELIVPDDNVAGYAAFENGQLARAIFVNLNEWLTTSTGSRPSVHINLSFASAKARSVPSAVAQAVGQQASAKRLLIAHADDTEGLTWAGQSFETPDALPIGGVIEEQVTLAEGFDLPSSEVVLLAF